MYLEESWCVEMNEQAHNGLLGTKEVIWYYNHDCRITVSHFSLKLAQSPNKDYKLKGFLEIFLFCA